MDACRVCAACSECECSECAAWNALPGISRRGIPGSPRRALDSLPHTHTHTHTHIHTHTHTHTHIPGSPLRALDSLEICAALQPERLHPICHNIYVYICICIYVYTYVCVRPHFYFYMVAYTDKHARARTTHARSHACTHARNTHTRIYG
jgi:hypothetical protein